MHLHFFREHLRPQDVILAPSGLQELFMYPFNMPYFKYANKYATYQNNFAQHFAP